MGNFQGTFETPKRSLISAFSICMTLPLRPFESFETVKIDTQRANSMGSGPS